MTAIGVKIGVSDRRRRAASQPPQGPVSDAGIVAVRADGWSLDYASPPVFDPVAAPRHLALARQGYSAAGMATTHTELIVLTSRVRQPYPSQALPDPTRVAIADYVYATDQIIGSAAPNLSAETSPKPIANWALPDRRVIGNLLRLELVAFHRNARNKCPVACVEFRASDGTATVSQVVATPVVLGHPGDVNPVIGYTATLDVTTLANGPITANARVLPWIGTAASIADSAQSSLPREFSPQRYLKNPSLAAAPPLVYVNAGSGNDTTGAVSTSSTTAEASPCQTIAGALNRLVAVNGTVDGAIIRLMTGTHVFATAAITATRPQTGGELVITRDPNAARSSVILQFGATAASRPRLGAAGGWLRLSDLTVSRQGSFALNGETASALRLWFDQIAFDNGSINAALYANADGVFTGVQFAGLAASVLNAGPREHRLLRGITTANGGAIEGWLVLGSAITAPGGGFTGGPRSLSGAIFAFNRVTGVNSTSGAIELGLTADVTGVAIVQNLFEYTAAATQFSGRVSGDSATGNNSHILFHHNTFAGAFQAGRLNGFYDEGPTRRTSKLMSVVGNIFVSVYTKSDLFRGQVQAGADASAATGNWAFAYGVGCNGNLSQYQSATPLGGNEAQIYPGLRCRIGTSQTVRNDPMFLNNQATTYTGSAYVAGIGGGIYALQSGSPAQGLVATPVLPVDLGGNARPAANDSAGAFALGSP